MQRQRRLEEIARRSIAGSIAAKQAILADAELLALIVRVAQVMVKALEGDHRVFFFGNGGSAADAQHLAAELVGRYTLERPGLPALALTANTSSLTAIANDYTFKAVFSRQVQSLGGKGDVAVGISTSGNSASVLAGLQSARRKGMETVGLSGGTGGKLKKLARYCICVPASETPRVQEAHIMIGHILCEIVEQTMFNKRRTLGSTRPRRR